MEPENSFHQFLNDVIGLYEGVTDDSDREEVEILESNRVLVILDNFEDIQHPDYIRRSKEVLQIFQIIGSKCGQFQDNDHV